MSSHPHSSAAILSSLVMAIVTTLASPTQGQTRPGSQAPAGLAPSAEARQRPSAVPQPRTASQKTEDQPLSPEQQQRRREAAQKLNEAQTHAQQGRLTQASTAAKASADILREIPGRARAELADALDMLARIEEARGDFPAEIRIRSELVKVLTNIFRESDWRVTDARLLIATRQRVHAMSDAEKRTLQDAGQAFSQGLDLDRKHRIDEAIAAVTRARDQFRDVLGSQHRDVATCDVTLGRAFTKRGDHAQARACYERALRLRRLTLGESHPETNDALTKLGEIAEAEGDLVGAKRFFEQAISRRREAHQGDDETVALHMEDLARLLRFLGDHDQAKTWLQNAVRLRRVLAAQSRTMALRGGMTANDEPRSTSRTRKPPRQLGLPGLGGFGAIGFGGPRPFGFKSFPPGSGGFGFPSQIGSGVFDLEEGRRENQQDLLSIVTQPTHPWSLRARARLMLDHEMAAWPAKMEVGIADETISEMLIDRHRVIVGPRSTEPSFRGETWIGYARTLGRLAGVSWDQGRLQEARLLQLAALRIGLEATDPNEPSAPQYAEFVDQFIDLLQGQGELPLCQTLAHEMVLLRRRDFGPKHPAFAAGLEKLAQVLWARGDHTQATLLLEKAIAIRRAAQGEAHPDLGDLRFRLALLHRDRGELDESRQLLLEALDQYEGFVFSTVPFVPERERLLLLARFSRMLAAYLDLSADDPGLVESAYGRLLAWKGIATAVATAQRESMSTPERRSVSQELGQVRDELNRLYYAQVPPEKADVHARRLREQLARRSELESRLAKSIGWSRPAIGTKDVAGSLPPGTALVDLFRYMRYVPATSQQIQIRNQPPFFASFQAPPTEGPALRFEAHYVAFVVRRGRSLARVDLGPAEPIDQAVMAMVHAIENDGDFTESAGRLSRTVWRPLEARLGGADWVLVAPDGALSFLPWAALPGRKPSSFLLEEHGFGLVTAARQLVESQPALRRNTDRRLLVVGGVDYNHAESSAAPSPADLRAGEPLLASATTRAGAFAGDHLELGELPDTLKEAQQVSEVFRKDGPGRVGGKVIRFDGAQATKDRVRSAMAHTAYLHLATHGYFAAPNFASALAQGTLKIASRSLEGADRSEVHGLYPGLLSGLIWAGANHPETDPVTGGADLGGRIMTAEEVAGLDLTECELAVLSACRTGQGEVAGGEGVIGLERAFHEAGARRVVASLWNVDDQATRELMRRFYTYLWRDRLDAMQALYAAQREMLDESRREGMSRALGRPEKSGASRVRPDSPKFWAAWQISGRPEVFSDATIWRASLPPRPYRIPRFDRRSIVFAAVLLAATAVAVALARRNIRRGRGAGPAPSILVDADHPDGRLQNF